MTARCPRCHREAAELTAFCTGCGAPLLLKDEAPTAAVAAPVNLDRRSRGAAGPGRGVAPAELPGPAAPPPLPRPAAGPRADELVDVEKSHWDLGPIAAAAARAEPLPAKPPPPREAGAEATRNVVVPPIARTTPAPTTTSIPTSTSTANPSTTTTTTTSTAPAPAPAPFADSSLDDLPDAEVEALEIHVARAASWRRVVAWVVDVVPFVAAGGSLASALLREAAAARGGPRGLEDLLDLVSAERVIAGSVAGAVVLALATYATLAHALGGATLGKRLVGIRVVGPDGGPPSPARSAARSLLAVLSVALLGLGFLLALFTRTGRALHDLLARTWVVKAP